MNEFLRLLSGRGQIERSTSPLSFNEWLSYFTYAGNQYAYGLQQTLQGNRERIGPGYPGLVTGAYKGNAVVFACMGLRLRVFSEARFQFRQLRSGRPGDLFGTEALRPLEVPWTNGTTGDLLARAIQDADLAGNFFPVRRGNRLKRLRPDWVTLVMGSENDPDLTAWDPDAELIGLIYQPGGPAGGQPTQTFLAGQFAHFAPIPDPLSPWRGMSWLTPILREIEADGAATAHKLTFFENGATPNMVVKADPNLTPEKFKEWVKAFKDEHEGLANAYKTLFLGGGADATVVGANLRQLDFKMTQGAGETRIAAAAGTPPVLVGLSEGLQAATYSNYGQARRAFADETMRPTWRNFAGSMSSVIDVPGGSELWYDDRDIPFLAEDVKDSAEIHQMEAATIRQLIDAGFEPASVVEAVKAGDFARLKHTGLFSVQLQPPQTSAGLPTANGQGELVPAGANGGGNA
jgi:hypothetical protein